MLEVVLLASAGIVSFSCPVSESPSFRVAEGCVYHRTSRHNSIVLCNSIDDFANPLDIPPEVLRIGWNRRFVLAEQVILDRGGLPDHRHIRYWIIDTEKKQRHGPYGSIDELNGQRRILGIPESIRLSNPPSPRSRGCGVF